jgi:predicted RNase H-like nuclease (RuvC/YqgF family)
MKYLGIDFAWSGRNYSALSLLENNRLIETVYLLSDEEILEYIERVKPDKIAVDAALEVKN